MDGGQLRRGGLLEIAQLAELKGRDAVCAAVCAAVRAAAAAAAAAAASPPDRLEDRLDPLRRLLVAVAGEVQLAVRVMQQQRAARRLRLEHRPPRRHSVRLVHPPANLARHVERRRVRQVGPQNALPARHASRSFASAASAASASSSSRREQLDALDPAQPRCAVEGLIRLESDCETVVWPCPASLRGGGPNKIRIGL